MYKLNDVLIAQNKQKPIIKQILKEERKPFKLKRILADRKNVYMFAVIIPLIVMILMNGVVNYIFGVINNYKYLTRNIEVKIDTLFDVVMKIFDNIDYILVNHVKNKQLIIEQFLEPTHHWMTWLFLVALLSIPLLLKLHGFYIKHRKLDYGQKGDAEFAKLKDLKKQYKSVPQQTKEYKGQPGVPLTHFNDLPAIFRKTPVLKIGNKKLKLNPFTNFLYNGRYLIDQDTINTMVIGTSRSGKGESMVFPATDIDTRASEKPSLVFNDPKGGAPRSVVKSCCIV